MHDHLGFSSYSLISFQSINSFQHSKVFVFMCEMIFYQILFGFQESLGLVLICNITYVCVIWLSSWGMFYFVKCKKIYNPHSPLCVISITLSNVPAEAAESLMPVAHILFVQTRSGQMDFWFLAKDAILYKDEQVGPWIRGSLICKFHVLCNFGIVCMFSGDVYTNTQWVVQCNFIIGSAHIESGAMGSKRSWIRMIYLLNIWWSLSKNNSKCSSFMNVWLHTQMSCLHKRLKLWLDAGSCFSNHCYVWTHCFVQILFFTIA